MGVKLKMLARRYVDPLRRTRARTCVDSLVLKVSHRFIKCPLQLLLVVTRSRDL